MMLLDNDHFLMPIFFIFNIDAFTVSLDEPDDDSNDDTTAQATNDGSNHTTVRIRSLVDGVLVVSIAAVIEIVAITIVVNDEEDGRVITNGIIVVWRSIINV